MAQLGDRVLLNLCNYLRTPQRVVIVQNGQRTRALNLLTGEPVAGALHLAPLEPALIEIR
ncbi:MAG TPA: hypothetical protein EYP10_08270 [Armatimonadetes bacterium]|nr:hypothetical protein [Armatimonadota bacterium]